MTRKINESFIWCWTAERGISEIAGKLNITFAYNRLSVFKSHNTLFPSINSVHFNSLLSSCYTLTRRSHSLTLIQVFFVAPLYQQALVSLVPLVLAKIIVILVLRLILEGLIWSWSFLLRKLKEGLDQLIFSDQNYHTIREDQVKLQAPYEIFCSILTKSEAFCWTDLSRSTFLVSLLWANPLIGVPVSLGLLRHWTKHDSNPHNRRIVALHIPERFSGALVSLDYITSWLSSVSGPFQR